MAGPEEERGIALTSWKGLMDNFLWASKKLAAPFLKPFGPSSEPACIDKEDLENLNRRLAQIRAVLRDAETREISDQSVKLWLYELKELEHGAEDIIEEFEFLRASRLQELELELLQPGTRKRKREVRSTFSSPPLSCLARKVRKIRERFDEIASNRKALRLREGDGERRPVGPVRPPSSSLVDVDLYGREDEMEEVINLVLSDPCQQRGVFSVVPIVGMGGVGKTTLVQHVYNDKVVLSHFDLRAWVCASQDFDVIRITRAIIEGFSGESCCLTELNVLQEVVVDKLKGRRFLLVLDDLWVENPSFWESLQVPLNVATRGSKVIVTTRNARVARIMGASFRSHLKCLSDHNCWLICQRHAFDGRDPHPNLAQIGKATIARCNGLPLAAKALGGLLRSSIDEEHWSDVLQSELWQMDELQNRIMPVLRLSYDHLPLCVKRCFVYCSLFPKGYIFERDQLVRLWMAQGFLELNGRSRLEDIGNKHFDDLVGRTFFQYSSFYDHSEERYVMHDLFHELAQYISGDECCRTEDYKLCEVHEKARHSSLVPHESHFEKIIQFESFDGQDLRSFLFVGRLEYKLDQIPFVIKIPNDLFLLLECLRALDLSNTNIEGLPNSIGNMKHLRYLGLRNTRIKRLPESICSLFNLQTLDLKCCYYLQELPIGIRYLSKLRHLEVPVTEYSNICMPSGIGELTNLQTLPIFIVGSSSGRCGIGELKNLVNLRGDLHISGLSNVVHGWDAEEANLKNKENIQNLTLQWFSLDRSFLRLDDESVSEVLERLQPHTNLEVLVIKDYCGIRFAKWMGDPIFSKLVTMSLKECGKCRELPQLGQLPSLRHLTIQLMAGVQSVGYKFCGSKSGTSKGFPMLETLEFRKMYEWEKWSEVEDGDFPRLRSLTISGCRKLKALPQIKSLEKLGIHYCEQLRKLPPLSSLQSLKMEGYQNLKHLPQLPNLSALEMLEIGCCNQLTSVGNLQHLASLRKLKVTKCLKLCLSRDEQLPLMVHVDIRGGCPLLNCEANVVLKEESQILVSYDQPVGDFNSIQIRNSKNDGSRSIV